mgnify:CR=1 FL=1
MGWGEYGDSVFFLKLIIPKLGENLNQYNSVQI